MVCEQNVTLLEELKEYFVIIPRGSIYLLAGQWTVACEVKVTQSCPTLYSPWNSPGQNTGVGSPSLLQGIFPTQGSNPGLPHCGRTR